MENVSVISKPNLLAKMIDFDPFLAGNGQNTNNLILKLCPIHVCSWFYADIKLNHSYIFKNYEP